MTDGGVIVGQRLCGEWKSTQPGPDGWRIIFLITFWRPLQATPASAEEHPPSGEHRQGAFLPQISGYTRRGDAAGHARLQLCLHALSKCLRNYSCAQYGTCYVGGSRTREKLGMPMPAYSFLLLPRQNHHPATFPSPAAENVRRSAPPHHHISQTSAKHQPNTIWQNHLRLSSFRQSVVLA